MVITLPPSAVKTFSVHNARRISHGRQHEIYAFKEKFVIKVPRKKKFEPPLPKEQILEDLAILSRYFPNNLPRTDVYDHPKYGYVIVQEYLKDIQPIGVKGPYSIRSQLRNILRQNRKMKEKTKLSLDFFGHSGFDSILKGIFSLDKKRVKLCNLGVVPMQSRKVYILDTNLSLLTPMRQGRRMWLQYMVDIVSYNANKLFLFLWFGEKA